MFQPTRPADRWSSVARLRASRYGGYSEVDMVATMPSREVCAATVATSPTGSCLGA